MMADSRVERAPKSVAYCMSGDKKVVEWKK
jgi:hypothetical protein